MKIAIVIPTGDMVHADFAICLTRMVVLTASRGIEVIIINPKSSLVQKGRWSGVKEALKHKVDKILFIDSDQTFPADSLLRLINHHKSCIGATYRLRQEEVQYVARNHNNCRMDFSKVVGLIKVKSNGLGFSLIDARLFNLIREPWFEVSFEFGGWLSEDEFFCEQVHLKDCKVYVDADLTRKIGHIGTKVYI